ncbi:MAG: phytanoyl-CoA dioxygenase family protein [Candidatus Eremiobacteraeota bacterium]|nr:phytanoyl-CoA dioxygenase family protein [Candidatus Eremiobacteraeota bacterium]
MTLSTESGWLDLALDSLKCQGYAIVGDVLSPQMLERTRRAMYGTRERVVAEAGEDRLVRAGEKGVLRIPFRFDPIYFEFLTLRPVLDIVDATVGSTAILHLMNGFILPPIARADPSTTFQESFHRDFPRYLNGYVASINAFFAIVDFKENNGATLVVPGTHQRQEAPSNAYMKANAVPILAKAGSMLLFDSTLWHAAGQNRSGADRLAINMQFTRSYIKQQIDYSRALDASTIEALPARSQQLLGWYTRVVTSLDEYYRPEEERLYRRGQG